MYQGQVLDHDLNCKEIFLAETLREENIFYAIDPNWTGASMAYAHILWVSDDCMLGCNCNNHGNHVPDLSGDIQ